MKHCFVAAQSGVLRLPLQPRLVTLLCDTQAPTIRNGSWVPSVLARAPLPLPSLKGEDEKKCVNQERQSVQQSSNVRVRELFFRMESESGEREITVGGESQYVVSVMHPCPMKIL